MNIHTPAPTFVIPVNIGDQVLGSSGQHQPSATPHMTWCIWCLEASVASLLHAFNFLIHELNRLVASEEIFTCFFAKLSRIAMIPGNKVVHLSCPFITIDTWIKYSGGIKLAGEASRYGEARGAAADDQDVKKRRVDVQSHGGSRQWVFDMNSVAIRKLGKHDTLKRRAEKIIYIYKINSSRNSAWKAGYWMKV